MSYRWDLQAIPPQFQLEVSQRFGKYAAKLLALRGMVTAEAAEAFISPSAYVPTAGQALPDLDRAVSRILQARERGERVVIWGDFDCDGVTSTALLLSAFQPLGLDLSYTIPLRAAEGHGLNLDRLEKLASQGTQLIVTVDCGVGNPTVIAQAQAMGIEVIVTDHHLLPDPLPPAYAVVNPLRLPNDHALRFLPGVGVAYKLAEAVYQALALPNIEQSLDLAAIGIVADVAVLQRECRYLVQKGLPFLAKTQRVGLQHLIQAVVKPDLEGDLSAQDIGFRIAPKLNAIGRLDDASLAVELLTTSDPVRAQALVDRFIATNEERKELTELTFQQACQQVDLLNLQASRAIVLAKSGWHQGVVGIVASKLVERYGCPAVLIACPKGRDEGYGSGRSIPGVNLVAALDAVQPLLNGHGGHPMAAGLRVSLDKLEALQFALSRELATRVSGGSEQRDLSIEIYFNLLQTGKTLPAELDDLWEQLSLLEPFGHGHPRPTIALLNFRASAYRLDVSRDGRHLKISLGSHKLWFWGEGSRFDALAKKDTLWDIAFVMEASTWKQEGWQGKILDIRAAQGSPMPQPLKVDLTIQDARRLAGPLPTQAAVYQGQIPAPAPDLILSRWPLLPESLQKLLQAVNPQQIWLAARADDFTQANQWVAHLVQQWGSGIRQAELLAESGIPTDLIALLLRKEQTDPSFPVGAWLVELLRESQSFQQWLDHTDPGEILKLCKRLISVRTIPPPA